MRKWNVRWHVVVRCRWLDSGHGQVAGASRVEVVMRWAAEEVVAMIGERCR